MAGRVPGDHIVTKVRRAVSCKQGKVGECSKVQLICRPHAGVPDLYALLCHFSPTGICILCDRIVPNGDVLLLKYRTDTYTGMCSTVVFVLVSIEIIQVFFPPRKPGPSPFAFQGECSQCLVLTMEQIFGSQRAKAGRWPHRGAVLGGSC